MTIVIETSKGPKIDLRGSLRAANDMAKFINEAEDETHHGSQPYKHISYTAAQDISY